MILSVIIGFCVVLCVSGASVDEDSLYHGPVHRSQKWTFSKRDLLSDLSYRLFHRQHKRSNAPPTRELEHISHRLWGEFESVDPPTRRVIDQSAKQPADPPTWRAIDQIAKKLADPPTIREANEPPTKRSENHARLRAANPPTIYRRVWGNKKDESLEEQACSSGRLITCQKGTVTSLGYPDAYPPNATCKWLIQAPKTQVIEIDFTDIALRKGDCVSLSYRGSAVDYIYNPAVKLCGEVHPKKFTSVGNELEVLLTTDDTDEGPGILFNYYIRDPVECEDVIELQDKSGTLSSSGYPEKYHPQANCTWRIIGPSDRKIILSFTDIGIEHARSCEYDVVTLYDGPETSDARIGAYCGHKTPGDVTSTSNVVLVVLTSDSSSEDVGFQLTWTVS